MGRARRCVLGRRDLAGLYILLSGCVFNGITWVLCGSGGGRLIFFFWFLWPWTDPSRAFNYIIFFFCYHTTKIIFLVAKGFGSIELATQPGKSHTSGVSKLARLR